MDILASCSYEESLSYNGKLIIESEDGKQDRVSLNIVVTDGNTDVLNNLKPSVRCVTFRGSCDLFSVEIPEGMVFIEYDLDSVPDVIPNYEGVTPIVRVPENYSDMRELYDLCQRNEKLRVLGGNLLNIDGVRIGRYAKGKDKGSPIYNGVYDTFLELPLSELGNLKDVLKKARKRINEMGDTNSLSPKKKKSVVKSSNISKSLSTLFSGIEEEDF